MRMVIASRLFGITINGEWTEAVIPFADMLNHKQPSEAKWAYSDERGGFLVEALEDLAKGVPVQYSYGTKCNSRLFLCYGFVLPDNAANAVPLQVSLTENSTDKLEMLKSEESYL